MDRHDTDFHLQCRLCSSKLHLVSLFHGKNKKIRKYIRQIVKTITGIKFEKNDFFDCICLACIIHTYNQHIFVSKSVENEERLQSILQERSPNRKNKYYLKCPKELELLNSVEVKKAIVEWIMYKQEIVSSDSSDRSSCQSEKILSQESDNEITTNVEKKSRPLFDVGVQTMCKSVILTRDTYSQTDETMHKPAVLTKETDSQTEPKPTKEQFTQYIIDIVHAGTQCTISDKTVMDGCSQTEMFAESQFIKYGDVNKLKKNCDKFVIDNGRLVKLSSCIHNTLNDGISVKRTTPIEGNINVLSAIGLEFELLTPKSSDVSNNNSVDEEKNGKERQIDDFQQVLSINCQTSETDSIKMEQDSPKSLSLNTSIHLKASPQSDMSFESGSNPLLLEPAEARPLRMCQICEKPFYTKSTFDAHKKEHMKCSLCQKTFRSIKKRDEHYTICTILNRNPFVMLEKMEEPINATNISVLEKIEGPTNSRKISDAITIPTISTRSGKTIKKLTGKSGGRKRKLDQDKEKPSP